MSAARTSYFISTLAAALSLLVGCGGGGGSSSSDLPSPSNPPTPAPGSNSGGGSASGGTPPSTGSGSGTGSPGVGVASVGGLWSASGTASNGGLVDSKVLITEDGRSFGISVNRNTGCTALTFGSLTTSGNAVSGRLMFSLASSPESSQIPACAYSDASTSASGVFSGSFIPRTSLSFAVTGSTLAGAPLPAGETQTMYFDSLYSLPSSLNSVQGSWIGATGNSVSVGTSGQWTSTDSSTGCVIAGAISIIHPAFNAYAISAFISGCNASTSQLNGAVVKGLAFLDNRATPSRLIIGQETTLTNGLVLVAATSATR